MRLSGLALCFLLGLFAASGPVSAEALPAECKGVTIAQLKDYLQESASYLKQLNETKWEIPDPADPTKKVTVKLTDALRAEVTEFEKGNLLLMKTCVAALQSALQASDQTQQTTQQQASEITISIVSASYGDHRLQHKCEHAERDRYGAHGSGHRHSRCSFVCDAVQPVSMACSRPIKPGELKYVDSTTLEPVPFEENAQLKIGTKTVNVVAGSGQKSAICAFKVDEGLCFNIDPSPDSPKKTLELVYVCSDKPDDEHEIVAGKGASIVISCPQAARTNK